MEALAWFKDFALNEKFERMISEKTIQYNGRKELRELGLSIRQLTYR